jgi:hypothetical protein
VGWTHQRALVANLSKSRHPSDPELLQARADLAAEVFLNRLGDLVAEPPPLSDEQHARAAAIVTGLRR